MGATKYGEMSVAERILLLQELWDDLAASPDDIELTEAQREELDWRIAEHRAAPDDVQSWPDVKRRARAAR